MKYAVFGWGYPEHLEPIGSDEAVSSVHPTERRLNYLRQFLQVHTGNGVMKLLEPQIFTFRCRHILERRKILIPVEHRIRKKESGRMADGMAACSSSNDSTA